MKKDIKMDQFADDLVKRIDKNKTIDCCKEEIKKLAEMAKQHMSDKTITVTWKDE